VQLDIQIAYYMLLTPLFSFIRLFPYKIPSPC
jgi:hypothetical protein